MPVSKKLDVYDDFIAHILAAFKGGRTHVRQQDYVVQSHQLRVYRRFVFEHVEPGACNFAGLQQPGQGGFVNDLAARGVDDNGVGNSLSRLADNRWNVAGVCGQLTETKSMRAII